MAVGRPGQGYPYLEEVDARGHGGQGLVRIAKLYGNQGPKGKEETPLQHGAMLSEDQGRRRALYWQRKGVLYGHARKWENQQTGFLFNSVSMHSMSPVSFTLRPL